MASEHHLFEIEATWIDKISVSPCFGSSPGMDSSSSWSPCIQDYHWRCGYSTDFASRTLSFTLRFDYSNIDKEPVNASFKLTLLDRGGRPVPSRTRSTSLQNCQISQNWQWECPSFITRDDQQRQEYINKDGRFTVRCDIAIKHIMAKADIVFPMVPPSDLHRHLGDLLAHKDGADVTFQVPGGEMMESNSTGVVIQIEDMEAQVFSSMLAFIYTDLLPDAAELHGEGDDDDDEAMVQYQHLLAAADRYGLERMKLVCHEQLCKHIRADSVATMLVLADRHNCPGLKEACFHFLTSSANLDSFTETDGYEVINASCPAVLKELLAKLATVLIF